jgi:hypothetical protein
MTEYKLRSILNRMSELNELLDDEDLDEGFRLKYEREYKYLQSKII